MNGYSNGNEEGKFFDENGDCNVVCTSLQIQQKKCWKTGKYSESSQRATKSVLVLRLKTRTFEQGALGPGSHKNYLRTTKRNAGQFWTLRRVSFNLAKRYFFEISGLNKRQQQAGETIEENLEALRRRNSCACEIDSFVIVQLSVSGMLKRQRSC